MADESDLTLKLREQRRFSSLLSILNAATTIWRLWSFVICSISVISIITSGPEWVVNHILSWSVLVAAPCIALLPVCLVLLIWRASRSIGAIGMYFCSSVALTQFWVVMLVGLKAIWGTFGVITGLLLFGWGVIPLGIIAQFLSVGFLNSALFTVCAIVLTYMKVGGFQIAMRDLIFTSVALENSSEV